MADGEFLPQEIINHIQSFLSAREHAQTSVLSKSWYSSWPTRPVLVLNESYDDASLYSTETLNRYKTLNLRVDEFMLRMKRAQRTGVDEYEFSRENALASHLIISALKSGVSEIGLEINNYYWYCDLPVQVFSYTSLIRLSVDHYKIEGVIGNSVLCSRLKSLVLYNVITTPDVMRDILFGCPLIENLDLSNCFGLDKLNVSKSYNLVEFRIVMEIAVRVEFFDLGEMNVTKFQCLRLLEMKNVRITCAEFFTKFGFMFPCVEDLTIGCCGDYGEINISSHSVKRLCLYKCVGLTKVQLNVPNISDFEFENSNQPLPSLCFDNVSRNWESEVKLWCLCDVIEACWFVELRKFLNQLTRSRISLDITFTGTNVIISGEKVPCFPTIPVVEDLRVCTCCCFSSDLNVRNRLLLDLSTSCRPKMIWDDCCDY